MKEPAKQKRRREQEGRGRKNLLAKHSEKRLAHRVARRGNSQRDVTHLTFEDHLQRSRRILGDRVNEGDPLLRIEKARSHLDTFNGITNAKGGKRRNFATFTGAKWGLLPRMSSQSPEQGAEGILNQVNVSLASALGPN